MPLLLGFLFTTIQASVLPSVPDDSIPFAVKITTSNLNSTDTSYEFSAWIRDTSTDSSISQIWTPDGWKSSSYQPFYSKTGQTRSNWIFLKIYRHYNPASYYFSFKYKDGDTEQVYLYYPDFRIIDMHTSGGWLQGTLYKDSLLTTPYPNVIIIAKDSSNNPLGCYITEDNKISDNNPSRDGWFSIAVPVGNVSKLEFEDVTGNTLNAYLATPPPFNIKLYDTTFTDPVILNNVSFSPETPTPGDSLLINVELYNPGNAVNNVKIDALSDNVLVGTITVNTLAEQASFNGTIVYKNLQSGKHKIEIKLTVNNCATTKTFYIQVGTGNIIINEIMYRPSNSGEWLELMNKSNEEINIANWTLDNQTITDTGYSLKPSSFVVIAESSSQVLNNIYGNCNVISLGSIFPNLRDGIDTLTVRDNSNLVQDLLTYDINWASNSDNGISLERISSVSSTNDADNWNSCTAPLGATPCKINSICSGEASISSTLTAQPRIFSPNKHDSTVTRIFYTLPFTKAIVKLYIYDRNGRCIRKLLDNYSSGSQSKYIWQEGCVWDGKNDSGSFLTTGIYIVYLEAKDESSTKAISNKTTVVLKK
ncbi:MAG: lamin tail domain-containing protein [bacterium]|nr:lamin tail domain-containing protein [bacterium]